MKSKTKTVLTHVTAGLIGFRLGIAFIKALLDRLPELSDELPDNEPISCRNDDETPSQCEHCPYWPACVEDQKTPETCPIKEKTTASKPVKKNE